MAADLYIHVYEPGSISQYAFNVHYSHISGSPTCGKPEFEELPYETEQAITNPITKSPNVWIGENSTLKAMIFDDDNFIPDIVMAITDLIDKWTTLEHPIISDTFLKHIEAIFDQYDKPHQPSEGFIPYQHTKREPVIEFLRTHMGEKCYTINW